MFASAHMGFSSRAALIQSASGLPTGRVEVEQDAAHLGAVEQHAEVALNGRIGLDARQRVDAVRLAHRRAWSLGVQRLEGAAAFAVAHHHETIAVPARDDERLRGKGIGAAAGLAERRADVDLAVADLRRNGGAPHRPKHVAGSLAGHGPPRRKVARGGAAHGWRSLAEPRGWHAGIRRHGDDGRAACGPRRGVHGRAQVAGELCRRLRRPGFEGTGIEADRDEGAHRLLIRFRASRMGSGTVTPV